MSELGRVLIVILSCMIIFFLITFITSLVMACGERGVCFEMENVNTQGIKFFEHNNMLFFYTVESFVNEIVGFYLDHQDKVRPIYRHSMYAHYILEHNKGSKNE